MKFFQRKPFFAILLSIVFVVILMLGTINSATANEIMRDRCSGDVAIVPKYEEGPYPNYSSSGETEWVFPIGTRLLVRNRQDSIDWSEPITVKTDDAGRIRWWCNSTTSNWLDPGTWRIDGGKIAAKCGDSGCTPSADLDITPQNWGGWTAERSRCDNRSGTIRARLGSGRLLQIECLDPNTNTSRSRLTISNCSYGPDTCIQGFVWREANQSDRVCVLPSVRQQARTDNASAPSRRSPTGGAYGPDTCLQGYVWRDAFPGDHTCVTPAIRQQAAFDNRRKAARVACR